MYPKYFLPDFGPSSGDVIYHFKCPLGDCISDNNNIYRGARGVMVIIVGNGHDDTSSNPGRD